MKLYNKLDVDQLTSNVATMPQTTEPWHAVSPEQTTELLQGDADCCGYSFSYFGFTPR